MKLTSSTLAIAVAIAVFSVTGAGAIVDDGPVPVAEGGCDVPGAANDPRAMEVHLRCILARLGNPIVLPNPFLEDDGAREADQELFNDYCKNVEDALKQLQKLKGADGTADPSAKAAPTAAAVGDAEELIRSTADAVRALTEQLQRIADAPDQAPNGGDPVGCRALFGDDDEGRQAEGDATARGTPCQMLRNAQVDPDARLDDDAFENGAGRKGVNVRLAAHLVPFPRFGSPHIAHERAFTGQVPDGGAHVVTKEFFGLQLRLFWRWVPIYVEPWYPRRRIIGYRRHLYVRWVPCEYIKSIVYQDSDDGSAIVPRISSQTHCDHSLLYFWRYFQ